MFIDSVNVVLIGHFCEIAFSILPYRLAKLDKGGLKSKLGFRDQLKSTGQSKYALEEKEEVRCDSICYCCKVQL